MTLLAAPADNIWTCYPNFIHCKGGDHLWAHYKSGKRADLRGLLGVALIECRECSPHEYFLAVFSRTERSHVTCYLLSRASYTDFNTRPDDALPEIPELLYLARDPQGRSYNPNWRPPR